MNLSIVRGGSLLASLVSVSTTPASPTGVALSRFTPVRDTLRIAGIIIALACARPTAAQASTAPLLVDAPFLAQTVPGYPTSFALADLNGDNTIDIVATTGGSLGFLSGKGDGTFGPFQSLAEGSYWEGVASGDLNEDGAQDIVALSYEATANVFLGDGNGTFALFGRTDAMGSWPSAIVTADIDQDGHLDLVIASTDPFIHILPGHGDGTFGPGRSIPTQGRAQGVTVCDLDRNGILDLIVTSQNIRSFLIFIGTGGGQFAEGLELPAGFGPAGVAVADINGDTAPDVAVANGGWACGGVPTTVTQDSTVTVYLGDGAGHFTMAPSVLAGIVPWSVSFADVDSDGSLDMVVGNDLWRGGACFFGAPSDGSRPPSFSKAGAAPSALASPSSGLSIFRGRGNGTFDPAPMYRSSQIGFLSGVADLNQDGRGDILAVHSYHPSLAILLASEGGSFGGGLELPSCSSPQHVLLTDLTRDGRADVAIACENLGTIEVFRGRSDRQLGTAIMSPAMVTPRYLAAADLDNDGLIDLAVADFGDPDSLNGSPIRDGVISVLRGDGEGAFTQIGSYTPGGNIVSVRVGDLDEDGYPDIVAGVAAPPSVLILIGRGDGTFSVTPRLSFPGYQLSALALGDFNADRHLDVAISVPWEGVSVMEGRGDGTLREQIGVSPAVYRTLEAVDLDSDGASDLVASDGYAIDSYISNGDGAFRLQPRLQVDGLTAVAFPDLNGDGLVDLAATGFYQGASSVYTGAGLGLFVNRVDYGAGDRPLAIAAGDVDGDGQVDLAIAAGDGTTTLQWGRATAVAYRTARAFLASGQLALSAASNGEPTVFQLEPVGGSYLNANVILKSISLESPGTGSTGRIYPTYHGVVVPSDQDHNGTLELPVPFDAKDVGRLFNRVMGSRTVHATLSGFLASGEAFRAAVSLRVLGASPGVQAYLANSPSPDAATLYVTTSTSGPLSIRLYDAHGRLVRTVLDQPFAAAGLHSASLRVPGGRALASGVYFYRVEGVDGLKSGRVVFLR